MKFTLYEFLALPLLFVAISVTLAISQKAERRYPLGKRAESMVGELGVLVEKANEPTTKKDLPNTEEAINALFKEPSSKFNAFFGDGLRTDIWGNPYVCVVSESGQYDFFSYGVDRTSQSRGNDPDDLNSWDLEYEYYVNLEETRGRLDVYGFAAMLTLPIFSLLVCLRWLWQRKFKAK